MGSITFISGYQCCRQAKDRSRITMRFLCEGFRVEFFSSNPTLVPPEFPPMVSLYIREQEWDGQIISSWAGTWLCPMKHLIVKMTRTMSAEVPSHPRGMFEKRKKERMGTCLDTSVQISVPEKRRKDERLEALTGECTVKKVIADYCG